MQADLEALLIRLRSYGTLLCTAFPVEEMDDLLTEIEREETLMPLFDPTAGMVRNLLASGRLERYCLGRAVRVEQSDLERFIGEVAL